MLMTFWYMDLNPFVVIVPMCLKVAIILYYLFLRRQKLSLPQVVPGWDSRAVIVTKLILTVRQGVVRPPVPPPSGSAALTGPRTRRVRDAVMISRDLKVGALIAPTRYEFSS